MSGEAGIAGPSLSSDGSMGQGTVSSEPSGAQSAPREFSPTQLQAHKATAALYAEMKGKPASECAEGQQKIKELHGHMFGGKPAPEWLNPQDVPPPDMRPADSMRDALDATYEPFGEREGERLAMRMRTEGAGEWAPAAIATAESLGLPAAEADGFIRRVTEHVKSGGMVDGNFAQLNSAQEQAAGEALAHSLGGTEKARALVGDAIAFLERQPALLAKLDAHKARTSPIAYDPALILILANAERQTQARRK